MRALFPQWTNTALYLALGVVAFLLVAVIGGLMIYVRTPYVTNTEHPIEQPVEFDHRHHVRDDGIDCVYCHSGAERSPNAGVPDTSVCMGCHSQIWTSSPLLEPVRRSYFTGRPIRWRRVDHLPDFVYFNHSIHVRNGVGCVQCHGHVDQMARVYKVGSLQMRWCLDCHRDVHGTVTKPVGDGADLWGIATEPLDPNVPPPGRAITRLTTCTACHR